MQGIIDGDTMHARNRSCSTTSTRILPKSGIPLSKNLLNRAKSNDCVLRPAEIPGDSLSSNFKGKSLLNVIRNIIVIMGLFKKKFMVILDDYLCLNSTVIE